MSEKNQEPRTECQQLSAGVIMKNSIDELLKDFDGNAFVVIQSKQDQSMICCMKGYGIEVATMLAYNLRNDPKLRAIAEAAIDCTINAK